MVTMTAAWNLTYLTITLFCFSHEPWHIRMCLCIAVSREVERGMYMCCLVQFSCNNHCVIAMFHISRHHGGAPQRLVPAVGEAPSPGQDGAFKDMGPRGTWLGCHTYPDRWRVHCLFCPPPLVTNGNGLYGAHHRRSGFASFCSSHKAACSRWRSSHCGSWCTDGSWRLADDSCSWLIVAMLRRCRTVSTRGRFSTSCGTGSNRMTKLQAPSRFPFCSHLPPAELPHLSVWPYRQRLPRAGQASLWHN